MRLRTALPPVLFTIVLGCSGERGPAADGQSEDAAQPEGAAATDPHTGHAMPMADSATAGDTATDRRGGTALHAGHAAASAASAAHDAPAPSATDPADHPTHPGSAGAANQHGEHAGPPPARAGASPDGAHAGHAAGPQAAHAASANAERQGHAAHQPPAESARVPEHLDHTAAASGVDSEATNALRALVAELLSDSAVVRHIRADPALSAYWRNEQLRRHIEPRAR